jgi:hypothetical protein
MTHYCHICKNVVPPRFTYCPRCHKHFDKRHETLAHVLALIAAWDPIRNGFVCFYTGVILDENDPSSPWYLTFDHKIPGKKGDLVVCAAWVNSMKNQLSDEEFKAIIIELARCREAGEPFNLAVAQFKYWRAPARPEPGKPEPLTDLRLPRFGDCVVCSSRTYPYSPFCPICRNIVRQQSNIRERTAAMQDSWNPARKAFICYLTGLILERLDNKSPVFLTFEHRIPRMPGTLRMAAAFANVMKSALSEDEFWLAVKELARHFLTKEAFDRDVIKFAYWKGWAKSRRMTR